MHKDDVWPSRSVNVLSLYSLRYLANPVFATRKISVLRYFRSTSRSEFETPLAQRLAFAAFALLNLAFAIHLINGRSNDRFAPPIANIDLTGYAAVASIPGEWKSDGTRKTCDDPSSALFVFGRLIEVKNSVNRTIFSPSAKYLINGNRLIMEYDVWDKGRKSWVRNTSLMSMSDQRMESIGAWIDGQGGVHPPGNATAAMEASNFSRCR